MADQEKARRALSDFFALLRDTDGNRARRRSTVDTLFWEYNNINTGEFEDTETRFSRYFPERRAYPVAFLASTLGFNKSSMQTKYNEILNRFKLDQRPRVPTLRNALHYERLKTLIMKYYELATRGTG